MRLSPRAFVLAALASLVSWPLCATTLTETPVPAPACGDEARMQYQELAEAGVPAEQLAQEFAACANDNLTPGNLTKTITVNNAVGSTFYEQMNGCGFHPQARFVACDVELKRTTWYGNYPVGSNEHVTFCFQCGGGPWIQVPGVVHVTNDISGTAPSYGFMAFSQVPSVCPAGGTGASFQVRATLSWAVPAANPCSNTPALVWGNQITFDTRDDP